MVQSQFELYGVCRKGVGPSGAAIPFSAAQRSFLHKFIILLTLSHISHTLFPPSFFSPVPQIERQTSRQTDKKSGEGLLGRHRKLIQGGIRLAPNKAQWWGIKRGQITYANWLRIYRIVHSVVRNKMLTKIQEKMLGRTGLKRGRFKQML